MDKKGKTKRSERKYVEEKLIEGDCMSNLRISRGCAQQSVLRT